MLINLITLLFGDIFSLPFAFAEDVSSLGYSLGTMSTLDRESQSFLLPLGDLEQTWIDGSEFQFAPDLQNITLLISVEGDIHAWDRTSGEPLWTLGRSTGTNGLDFHSTPLIQAHPAGNDSPYDGPGEGTAFAIEPQSGEIYEIPDSGYGSTSPLRPLRYTIPQLVEMSPIAFPGDGRVYVGEKESTLLIIDLKKGQLIHMIPPNVSGDDLICNPDLEAAGTLCTRSFAPSEVVIKRMDYQLTIVQRNAVSGVQKHRINFTSYGPVDEDHSLQMRYKYPADNKYMQPLPDGKVMMVQTLRESREKVQLIPLWMQFAEDKSPIVAKFDIFSSSSRNRAMALLQPHMPSQNLVPDVYRKAAAPDAQPFIGNTRDGSFFAMSPKHFPMVTFSRSQNKHHS